MDNNITFTEQEQEIMLTDVYEVVSYGGTLEQAYEITSQKLGHPVEIVRSNYWDVRKDSVNAREAYDSALSNSLVNEIADPLKSIDDHIVKLGELIDRISNPTDAVFLPDAVIAEVDAHVQFIGELEQLFSHKYLTDNEYDEILSYIDHSPKNARNFYLALENGWIKEPKPTDTLKLIYETLKHRFEEGSPNEHTAKVMLLMLKKTMEILRFRPDFLYENDDDLPF